MKFNKSSLVARPKMISFSDDVFKSVSERNILEKSFNNISLVIVFDKSTSGNIYAQESSCGKIRHEIWHVEENTSSRLSLKHECTQSISIFYLKWYITSKNGDNCVRLKFIIFRCRVTLEQEKTNYNFMTRSINRNGVKFID